MRYVCLHKIIMKVMSYGSLFPFWEIWSLEEGISSSERLHYGISHTRWNEHNMFSYESWGNWLQLRNSDWNLLGMKCEQKGRDISNKGRRHSTYETKKNWLEYLLVRYEDSDGSQKGWRPSTKHIYGKCVNLLAGCSYLQEDVMMKYHHKGNFNLIVHFLFVN